MDDTEIEIAINELPSCIRQYYKRIKQDVIPCLLNGQNIILTKAICEYIIQFIKPSLNLFGLEYNKEVSILIKDILNYFDVEYYLISKSELLKYKVFEKIITKEYYKSYFLVNWSIFKRFLVHVSLKTGVNLYNLFSIINSLYIKFLNKTINKMKNDKSVLYFFQYFFFTILKPYYLTIKEHSSDYYPDTDYIFKIINDTFDSYEKRINDYIFNIKDFSIEDDNFLNNDFPLIIERDIEEGYENNIIIKIVNLIKEKAIIYMNECKDDYSFKIKMYTYGKNKIEYYILNRVKFEKHLNVIKINENIKTGFIIILNKPINELLIKEIECDDTDTEEEFI